MTSTTSKGLLAIGGVVLLTSFAALHAPSGEVSLPIEIERSGSLSLSDKGTIHELAFGVPLATQQIDIDFTYSPVDCPIELDLGVRSPLGVRGWSEDRSDHIHIDTISASHGYLPGPIEHGTWSLLVGAANIPAGVTVRYQVTLRLSNRVDARRLSLRSEAGWFAGDLHSHSGHSDGYYTGADGTRRPVSVADIVSAAIRNRLDFVAVTDHNTASHWLDLDRIQPSTDRLLLLHGSEITTYRGHFNAIGGRRIPVFVLGPTRPMSAVLQDAAQDGAFVSINHPWLPNDDWCAGCGWSDTDGTTLAAAAGVEILNGPSRDADPPGWRFWANLLNAGHRVVAVGGSDAHNPTDPKQPLGTPTTMVQASALSEDALIDGLRSGRAYVRSETGSDATLDFSATSNGLTVSMGGALPPGRILLNAVVGQARRQELVWIKRGREIGTTPLGSNNATATRVVNAVAGDWFSVIVRRGERPTLLSNAIFIDQ